MVKKKINSREILNKLRTSRTDTEKINWISCERKRKIARGLTQTNTDENLGERNGVGGLHGFHGREINKFGERKMKQDKKDEQDFGFGKMDGVGSLAWGKRNADFHGGKINWMTCEWKKDKPRTLRTDTDTFCEKREGRWGMGVRLLLVTVFVLVSLSFVVAIPEDLSLNGRLMNSTGSALSGEYGVNFSIYSVSSGGSALWSSGNLSVVADSNGIFVVRLKNVDLNFSDDYYLGIKVEGDDEMTPRVNLSSSGYAFRARNVSIGGVEFDADVDVGDKNVTTTSWFRGLFNWVVGLGSGYLSFNGTTLNFNETELNLTIDARAGGLGTFVPYTGASSNLVLGNNNFSVGGSDFFVNNNNGRVGIGTTAPTGKFQVNSSGNMFFINGTNGNVGIGTASPVAHLQVSGNEYIRARFERTTGNGPLIELKNYDSTTYYNWFMGTSYNNANVFEIMPSSAANGNTPGSSVFVIQPGGNVGIGTTNPGNYKLNVNGPAFIGGLLVANGGLDNLSTLTVTGNTYLATTSGNVGIGTTSPGKKLVVNGTAGGLVVDVSGTMPTMNTTSGNVTITSAGGSVIVKLG